MVTISPTVGTELTLRVLSFANGGEAVGRAGDLVIFVTGAIPGELVRLRITEQRKTFARADVIEVIEAAPERIEPSCPYFGACGGCQWQYLRYDAQLTAKTDILRDQFRRALRLSDRDLDAIVQPAVGMHDPWQYRNVVRVTPTTDGKPAYHHRHSAALVPIDHCPISQPAISETLGALSAIGIAEETTIRVADTGEAVTETARERHTVQERLLRRTFRVSAGAFFQINTRREPHGKKGETASIADLLAVRVLEGLALTGKETVLDLYAGVGTFAILAAPHARHVIAVEDVPAAATDARFNAQANGMRNIEVHTRKAERFMPTLDTRVDVVVLDPPRAGCAPAVLDALLRLRPGRIVYVSCDVATLARDLRLLLGGYRIASSQVFDMFPQTSHIESVTVLTAIGGKKE